MRKITKGMTKEGLYNMVIDSLIENELSEFSSPEEYLKSKSVDSESLLLSGLSIVNHWKNKVRLEKRRMQYKALSKRLSEALAQLSLTPKIDFRHKLVDILAGGDEQMVQAYWHKLEKITDSDLENMLKEHTILEQFIEIFEHLDNELGDK